MPPTPANNDSIQNQPLADSPAFRAAALNSEVRRAYAVIGISVLLIAVVLMASPGEKLDFHIRLASLIGIGILLAMQLTILALARVSRQRAQMIPSWFIIAGVVIESLIPTGIIFSNIFSGAVTPFASLNSPPILGYSLLIGLMTLRLRPGLCLLAGVLSAAGYATALFYVMYGLGISTPTTGLPLLAYLNSIVLILISGLAGAWVAFEIRKHVEAALAEAQTRRKMDRIEQDLVVARSIQRALLPRSSPQIAGFDIAGWNRPADQTGGDYFDWQMLPDGNWIVSVADVSGHGIGPALVTAACRAYMRASSANRDDLPTLTARVNRLLADDLPDDRFVTMVSVVINPAGPLMLFSAGHGPIVLYVGATGAMEDILAQALPLAVQHEMTGDPALPVTMATGDVLALVTDGFVEWARPAADGAAEPFGLARLRESLARHARLPAAAIIEAITQDVTAFAHPAAQQDDLTMVVIKKCEPAK